MRNPTEPELRILAAYEKHMNRYTGCGPWGTSEFHCRKAISMLVCDILCIPVYESEEPSAKLKELIKSNRDAIDAVNKTRSS